MELKKGERMEKGVEAAMQELLCALSLNIIRVRRGSVCVCTVMCICVCTLWLEADGLACKCATGVCLYVSHCSVVSFLSWEENLIPRRAGDTHQP